MCSLVSLSSGGSLPLLGTITLVCSSSRVLCTSWQDGYIEPPPPTEAEKVRRLAAQIVERADAEKAAEEASSQAFAACVGRDSNQAAPGDVVC